MQNERSRKSESRGWTCSPKRPRYENSRHGRLTSGITRRLSFSSGWWNNRRKRANGRRKKGSLRDNADLKERRTREDLAEWESKVGVRVGVRNRLGEAIGKPVANLRGRWTPSSKRAGVQRLKRQGHSGFQQTELRNGEKNNYETIRGDGLSSSQSEIETISVYGL